MPQLSVLLYLLLCFLCPDLGAFPSLKVPIGAERVSVEGYVYHLDNSHKRLPREEVLLGQHDALFARTHERGIPIGTPERVQPDDTWLALEIDNEHTRDVALSVYGASSVGLTHSIRLAPDSTDIKEVNRFEDQLKRIPKVISIPPGHWKIYLAYQREPYGYPYVFLSVRTYTHLLHSSPERHIISLSLGICIALLLYNLVLAINLKSRSHWLYVLYNLAIVFYFETSGQILAEQFGWPAIPPEFWFFINSSALFLFAIFVYDILNIPQHLPIWKRPTQVFVALWPLLLLGQWIFPTLVLKILNILILMATPLSLAVSIHAAILGNPIAKLLSFTIILPALGSVFGLLANTFAPWMPANLIACFQPLGIDLEMIFLSMTIGYKLRRQQLSLRRRRDHAFGELKKIVFPHQVDQIWNGQQLAQTMPVGSSKAYTVVFDVIGSSRMPLADPRAFLSSVFTACSELMMENYQGEHLLANAYRVKEMGDGFICTVGFPFACPEPNAADHALKLSYRFMQTFADLAQKAGATQPLYCAVGIAYGDIEAFYPDNGTLVYDMYGRSIILATRYEGMRDYLFPHLGTKQNIVILQKTVFEALSPSLRSDFIEFELATVNFRVKDDEQATQLYYRLGPAS